MSADETDTDASKGSVLAAGANNQHLKDEQKMQKKDEASQELHSEFKKQMDLTKGVQVTPSEESSSEK